MSANKRQARSKDTRSKLVQILEELGRTSSDGLKKVELNELEHKTLSFIPGKIQTQIVRCYDCSEDVTKEYKFYCHDTINGPPEEELEWTVEPEVARQLIEGMLKGYFIFCITKYATHYEAQYSEGVPEGVHTRYVIPETHTTP